MKYRHVLDRRTMLKGAGISLGLPFLDSMRVESVYGQELAPEPAFLSLMYGLGSPYFVLDRGFEGQLRYYQALVQSGKLSLFTDVDMSAASDTPEVAQHHNGQPYLFSGYRTQLLAGNNVAPQGPSLHYAMMTHHYPGGPTTPFQIVDTGIYFRRGINYQYQRIYDAQGKNAADFEDLASPIDLFEKLFGNQPEMQAVDGTERARRSIIDYLIPAYEKYTTGASQLPAADVAILSNHLERVRQLERNVYATAAGRPQVQVTRPVAPDLDYNVDGGNCADPANVYHVDPVDFETAYQQLAELFAIGAQADYFRFGNLSFDSGGGHTHLAGAYPTPDDANNVFGSNPHEHYHALTPDNAEAIRITGAHNFLVHKNVAAALEKLDSTDFPQANGKTLLENAIVMVGSEVGTNHDVSRVFHGVAGGAGRLKMGQLVEAQTKAIELYNAIGHAFDLAEVGDGRDYVSDASVIVA